MVCSKQRMSTLAMCAAILMLLSITFSFLLHITISADDYSMSEMQGAFYITQTASMTVPPDTERAGGRYNASVFLSADGTDRVQRADLSFDTYAGCQITYDCCYYISMLCKYGINAEFNPAGVVMRC